MDITPPASVLAAVASPVPASICLVGLEGLDDGPDSTESMLLELMVRERRRMLPWILLAL